MQKNDTKNFVSIVVLTCNSFNNLFDTLDSIILQSYTEYELIISDDASDNFPYAQVLNWCEQKKEQGLLSCFSINQNPENMGIVAHSNNAVRCLCKGDMVKFLPEGDCFVEENSLQMLVDLLKSSKQHVVTAPALCYFDDNKAEIQMPTKKQVTFLNEQKASTLFSFFCFSNVINAVGTLYAKDFFNEGGFSEEYYHLDDWPTWLQIFLNGDTIPCAEIPAVFYKIGGMSTNDMVNDALKKDLLMCYENYIFANKSKLPVLTKYIASFRYKTLQGDISFTYYVKFLPLIFLKKVKKIIAVIKLKK